MKWFDGFPKNTKKDGLTSTLGCVTGEVIPEGSGFLCNHQGEIIPVNGRLGKAAGFLDHPLNQVC